MSFGGLVQLGWLGLDINSFEMDISRSTNRLFRYVMGVVSRGFEIVWCFDALKPDNENVFASKWSHSLLVRAVPCCLIADKSVAWTSWLAVGDLQSKFTASFKKMNLIENGYFIQLSWCWLLDADSCSRLWHITCSNICSWNNKILDISLNMVSVKVIAANEHIGFVVACYRKCGSLH